MPPLCSIPTSRMSRRTHGGQADLATLSLVGKDGALRSMTLTVHISDTKCAKQCAPSHISPTGNHINLHDLRWQPCFFFWQADLRGVSRCSTLVSERSFGCQGQDLGLWHGWCSAIRLKTTSEVRGIKSLSDRRSPNVTSLGLCAASPSAVLVLETHHPCLHVVENDPGNSMLAALKIAWRVAFDVPCSVA
jgi:hypothetical protein